MLLHPSFDMDIKITKPGPILTNAHTNEKANLEPLNQKQYTSLNGHKLPSRESRNLTAVINCVPSLIFPLFILCHPLPESLRWISRTISSLWLYFPWAAVWSLKCHCFSVCFYNCVCGCFPKCNDFLLYNGHASSQPVMVPRGRWVGRVRLNVNAQLSVNASNNVGNQSKNWQVRCHQIKNLL